MSKRRSKHHNGGEGERLIGSPEELINRLIMGESEKNWALNQLVNEGSKHKQVLTALLLNRLYKLMLTVENSSGDTFEMQDGYPLAGLNGDGEILFPLQISLNLGKDTKTEEIIEAISHASKHEVLAYAMAIQVIEWVISTTAQTEERIF
jgi:hypothetical protein